jgi:ribosome-associated protein
MKSEDLKKRSFSSELVYSTSRSSGPGGQNINKVNTKVELRFSLDSSSLFSAAEKEIIMIKLKNKINNEGEIVLVSQSERTQLSNKKKVTEKFYDLLSKALTVSAKRVATRPTQTSEKKRLEGKRIRGYIKKLRKQTGKSDEI